VVTRKIAPIKKNGGGGIVPKLPTRTVAVLTQLFFFFPLPAAFLLGLALSPFAAWRACNAKCGCKVKVATTMLAITSVQMWWLLSC